MTEREKIIELADDAGFSICEANEYHGVQVIDSGNNWITEMLTTFYYAAIADFLKSSGQYLTNDASREACIKQARDEAYEKAAVVAESLVWKQHHKFNDGEPFKDHMYWEDIATAIRQLKEQS